MESVINASLALIGTIAQIATSLQKKSTLAIALLPFMRLWLSQFRSSASHNIMEYIAMGTIAVLRATVHGLWVSGTSVPFAPILTSVLLAKLLPRTNITRLTLSSN